MPDIKVISFDMFQTLADVNSRKYAVCADILKEDYTKEKAEQLWRDATIILGNYAAGNFETLFQKFSACYKRLFNECGIKADVGQSVNILFREHGKAPIFPDAKAIFNILESKYRLWISSDADLAMIKPLLPQFKYEHAFISEEIGAYKLDAQGRFFSHILKATGVKPEEVLHVGDGVSDIVGAHRLGIRTCWINRDGKEWGNAIKPDYTVKTLTELCNVRMASN